MDKANNDELVMSNNIERPDIYTLLGTTDPAHIYLSSDWHFFKNHYKREANYVNTQKIVTWCRQNIRPTDVFMYLGDISFRYANELDKKESQRIMASIPGIKILVLGNHDVMAGDDYYTGCGFDYVFERIDWDGLVFTHRPINMDLMPENFLNIHGHIHKWLEYNTTDGKRNVNVYPYFYDNKPVTLKYILANVDKLTKDNKRSNWSNIGEASVIKAIPSLAPKAKVLYSSDITPDSIAYLVSQFKDKLKGNIGIKLHVGEEGNQNYLKPSLCKTLVQNLNATFIDSNVAYESKRSTTAGHLEVAKEHGFFPFDVLDSDEDLVLSVSYTNKVDRELNAAKEDSSYISEVSDGKHLKEINLGGHIKNYNSLIVFTHFKGHTMAGFGGSIKNIGMGIPSGKVGKLQVHGKDFKWGGDFLERLVESAGTINDYFHNKIIYVNVLKNMSTKCDCEKDAPKATIQDLGVLVSDDLVAIEQASIDLIRNAKGNKDLLEAIGNRGGMHQIEYAKFLGIGNHVYDLINIDGYKIQLETARENLPDSSFGIPEDRKYPLDTKDHVSSAIKLFYKAEEDKKAELAKRIKTAADKYGIDTSNSEYLNKYLTESYLIESNNDRFIIPDEVENIVFDMGSVLVDANTLDCILAHDKIPNEYANEIYDLIVKKMFYEKEDINIPYYDILQAKEYFMSVAPEHIKPLTDYIFETFLPAMFKYDYVDDLLNMLRAKGYKLYYLSNWDKYSYILEEPFFKPLIEKFDGGIFSFEVHCEKPSISIYRNFTNKFNLEPQKCLFFDDKQENIDAAINCGWHAEVFDYNTTPQRIINGLYKTDKVLDFKDLNSKIPVIINDNLQYVSYNNIKFWFVDESRYPEVIKTTEEYDNNLEIAIFHSLHDSDLEDNTYTDKYVFIPDKDNNLICIGIIRIYNTNKWNWLIQYPLRVDSDGYIINTGDKINELAMASCNPVKGITKPYILKVCDNTIINPVRYGLAMDLIPDKCLIINENAQLEVVDGKELNNSFIEEYEFVGDIRRLSKIEEAYVTGKFVDNTFFYTALTGKPMLTDDQIDFDDSFIKVNFEHMKESNISTIATLSESFMNALGRNLMEVSVDGDNLYKDLNGYYVKDNLTGRRSASVSDKNNITEIMKSVIKQ